MVVRTLGRHVSIDWMHRSTYQKQEPSTTRTATTKNGKQQRKSAKNQGEVQRKTEKGKQPEQQVTRNKTTRN